MTESIFMETRSGLAVDFDALDPAKIRIEDIALSLSRIPRYLGHTPDPLSVAEHCVRVSLLVEQWHPGDLVLSLRALLHDAAEAYVGDATAPVKAWIRRQTYALDVLETLVERAILSRFGLPHLRSGLSLDEHERIAAIIKRADLVMLATEKRDIVGEGERPWNLTHEPLERGLARPATAEVAERAFLDRFETLTEGGAR